MTTQALVLGIQIAPHPLGRGQEHQGLWVNSSGSKCGWHLYHCPVCVYVHVCVYWWERMEKAILYNKHQTSKRQQSAMAIQIADRHKEELPNSSV